MASRFISPFYDVGSGIKPSDGALLFFFEIDGVTPKDTFTTSAANIANTNPVVANSTGVFPDIYITGSYKVTLKDKDLTQKYGGAEIIESASGQVDEIIAGDGIAVDSADPTKPIISATGESGITPRYQAFPTITRSVDAAIYTKQNSPAVYDVTSNKTFLAFSGAGREPYVTYYDHSNNFWEVPVKLDINQLGDTEDNHGAPSIELDTNGFIHILYGSHNTKIYWAKSDSARDITAWTKRQVTEVSELTYPSLAVDSATGTLYAFFRAGITHGAAYPSHEFGGLMTLTLGGTTWSEVAGGIINTNGYAEALNDVYPSDINVLSSKVYIAWSVTSGTVHNDVRRDVSVAYYNPSDGDMYSVDDAVVGSIITFADRAQVLVDGNDYVDNPKFAFSGGNIYVSFGKAISIPVGSGHFVSVWGGSAWTTVDTGARNNYFFFSAAIRVKSDGSLQLFAQVGGDAVPTPFVSNAAGASTVSDKVGAGLAIYTADSAGLVWSKQQDIASKIDLECSGVKMSACPRNSVDSLPCLFGVASVNRVDYRVPIYSVSSDSGVIARAVEASGRKSRNKTIYSNYENVNIFDAFIDDTWVEIDLTEYISTSAHTVIVELQSANLSTGVNTIFARQAGSTRLRDSGYVLQQTAPGSATTGMILEIPLSFDGKIEVQAKTTIDRLRVKVIGYITGA